MSDLAEMTFDENQKTNQKFSISAGDVDYQKESLVILASLGTTKEYLGVEMSLEKIHKLPDKEVEKFFNRYQKVAGQKMANGLVDSAISTATKVISCFLPIDDTEELCYDLQNDELVKRELSNIAGLLVVRGGRLVALGSALFQVVRHIKFNRESENDRDAVGLSPEWRSLLAKIKIFSKQKAQTQTKSKQSLSSSLVYAGDSDRESGGAAGESQTACTSLADFKIFKIILKGDRYSLK